MAVAAENWNESSGIGSWQISGSAVITCSSECCVSINPIHPIYTSSNSYKHKTWKYFIFAEVSISWQLEIMNKGCLNIYVKMAAIITTYKYSKIKIFVLFPVFKRMVFLNWFAQFLNTKNKLGVSYLLLHFLSDLSPLALYPQSITPKLIIQRVLHGYWQKNEIPVILIVQTDCTSHQFSRRKCVLCCLLECQ
jgi:hypothetical protein